MARPAESESPENQGVPDDSVPTDTSADRVVQTAPQVQEQPANAINVREDIPAESGPVEPATIPASQLNRITYVGPEYPRSARRRNVTGSVDVTFVVTTDGRVRDVSVIKSEPGETFDQAAIDAVEQWRFEPIIENGVAVEKRSAVRLAFDM